MYVDDTIVCTRINCPNIVDNPSYTINHELDLIGNWLTRNKLSLNVNKSKFMVYQSKHKKVQIPNLSIEGVSLKQVNKKLIS